MLSGATRGAGGPALGRHVASEILNESVRMGPSRGLVADGIRGQVAELTDLVSHARTRTPIYHVHCDPEGAWGEQQRERFWELFEEEFGFQNQAYASQIHVKNDREHEHREYNRTRADGTAIRLDNDFARREKIARIVEHEFERDLVKGGWNKAVIAALERERPEVAAAMREAGLDLGLLPAPFRRFLLLPLVPLGSEMVADHDNPAVDDGADDVVITVLDGCAHEVDKVDVDVVRRLPCSLLVLAVMGDVEAVAGSGRDPPL